MVTSFELPQLRELFYGGAFHAARGGVEEDRDPATGESLGNVAVANSDDVEAAVAAAQEAFETWRDVPPADRALVLRRLADRLREHGDELSWIDARDTGNPWAEMKKDVTAAAAQIDYYAGLVREVKGTTLPMGPDALNYTRQEPLGVVARLVAYNHPLMFLASKLAPAIAAGNTVVMKAPTQAPLSGYRLAELMADIVPPGVVNILSGGAECGAALVSHPLVKKATLIGATPTGKAILKAAADKVMPVTLELGGKNPFILCPDADLDRAVEGAIAGMNFTWAGQSCGSASRCFVHRSVYDDVVERMARIVPERHVCGLPLDPATTLGSLVSTAQRDKVEGFIAGALEDGARLVCGGKRPSDPALANGCFVEATIFADVTPDMRLFRGEVFGPVLAVIPWDDEDEMIAMVNDCDYGLTAAIWTTDLRRAHRLAAAVESGFVWVNKVGSHFIGADFGGYKQSGMGREEGLAELLAFTQTKNVHVALD